jgi:hypothetical protein
MNQTRITPIEIVLNDLELWGVQDKATIQKILATQYNAMIRYKWIESFQIGSIEIVTLGKKGCKTINKSYRHPNPNQLKKAYQTRLILEQLLNDGWSTQEQPQKTLKARRDQEEMTIIISHGESPRNIRARIGRNFDQKIIVYHPNPTTIRPQRNLEIKPLPEKRPL